MVSRIERIISLDELDASILSPKLADKRESEIVDDWKIFAVNGAMLCPFGIRGSISSIEVIHGVG
jgi:hypothetical protein